jgi:hypothetical protein
MGEPEAIQEEVLDNVSTPEEKEQAAAQGWKEEPRDNFKTAREFLEFGQKVAPIQKERNEHLARELLQTKQTVEQMRSEFFKMQRDAEERGYKKAKADLLAEQKRAFDNADEGAYARATAQLEQLEPPKPVVAPQPEQINHEFIAWKAEKAQWYGQDVAMTAAADAIGAQLGNTTGLGGVELWNAVLKKVQEEFPHKFGNKNRQIEANAVEGGGLTPKPKGKKGYANLPADIKAQADHMVKSYGYKDREEYAASYWKQAEKYNW